MRINKNGTRFQQDLSIQHHVQQKRWIGSQAQTAEYYRRAVADTQLWLTFRQSDYARNFDPAKLQAAIDAVAALAAEVVG